jgi:hypothetical protein
LNLPIAPWGPVVENGENPFLQEYQFESLFAGRVENVPLLISDTQNEGLFPVGGENYNKLFHIKLNMMV